MQGEPLYEAFYGLREQPFALSTDPRFLFQSGTHRAVYDELLTGLRRREGLLLLTGETGTGKTTLCRALLEALGPRTFSALVLNPYMSDAEVLRIILRDFGLVSRDEIRRGALAKADMGQLLDTLESFLRSLIPLNSYAVLVIDEAQSLAPQVLDQVRMLGSFEQDGQRLLQIVLVGQPALAETVKAEPLRALNERITRRLALAPLATSEIHEYIKHRLAVAGPAAAVTFEPDAVRIIAESSRGLPRRINLLCDRSLEEGRVAGETKITGDMVRRAARRIAGGPAPAPEPAPAPASTAAPPLVAELPAMPRPLGDDLDIADLGPVEQTERPDIPLTFGQTPETPKRGRLVLAVGLVLLLLAGAVGAGGYAWTIVSEGNVLPPLPPRPKLDVGGPPASAELPSDEELPALLRAALLRQSQPPPTEAPTQ